MEEVKAILIGCRIPEPLAREFKIACVKAGKTQQAVIAQAIEDFIAAQAEEKSE